MQVYGKFVQKVDIDPMEVLSKLTLKVLNSDSDHVVEKNGKYFKVEEVSMGSHSDERETEITKEEFDYIVSIGKVQKFLKDSEK